LYHSVLILANLKIENFSFNSEQFGNTVITAEWNNEIKKLIINALAQRGNLKTIEVKGEYIPIDKTLSFNIGLDKFKLSIFQSYLKTVFSNLTGFGSGDISITGTLARPVMNGSLMLQKAGFMVNYLKTKYTFTTQVKINNNKFTFQDVSVYDEKGNTCNLSGSITNSYFKDIYLNLNLNPRNFLAINTNINDNSMYYGKVFASGIININGSLKSLLIDVSAKTEKNSVFYVPLNRKSDLSESTFIKFVNKKDTIQKKTSGNTTQFSSPTGLLLNFDLEVTPDAEVQLIFDPKIGDIMRGRGNGNIKMEINTNGKFNMYGDYTIDNGDYLFTLQNVINKRFIVEKGGTISWNGNPLDANLDILAVYRTKAALYNLFVDASEEYKRRIPIDCRLYMTGKLLNPSVKYDIYLPSSEEETRNKFRDAVNNEEELSKQFLSLLVINNFFPDPSRTQAVGTQTGSSSNIGRDMATTTSYELLSNQLSNWMSQMSKEFDIGINYRPGEDNVTSQEVEVALSTQILNDRVIINGNIDVGGGQVNQTTGTTTKENKTNNIVGDVEVEVKLTENGKLRLKVYNKANDQLMVYDKAPYTQGIGLFYREEFNNTIELRKRYLKKIQSDNKQKGKE
jgi:hypothetical protein